MNNKNLITGFAKRFPFSAIIGQEEMKLALILNSIDPSMGGVLVRGEKGTAKSTAVRALASLLPEIEVVKGCIYGCDPLNPKEMCEKCLAAFNNGGLPGVSHKKVPVVDLPLNATEEMVLGGLDFSKAVKTGKRFFMPGVMAKANRGFIYVDEVNLLDDHLVDIVLDAASCGVNHLEREGISFSHPARFVLVGTMNPEEGELRPQLLDRFGLCVEVMGEQDPDTRVELMELRESFDFNPFEFCERFKADDQDIAQKILRAQELVIEVILPNRLKSFISALCIENQVAGHRADLAISKAAKALAAYYGRIKVTEEDISTVAAMALRHRKRDALPPPPPSPPPSDEDPEQDQDQEEPPKQDQPKDNPPQEPEEEQDQEESSPEEEMEEGFDLPLPEPEAQENQDQTESNQGDNPAERVYEIGQTFKVKPLTQPKDRKLRRGSGRRSLTRTAQRQGRYVKSALYGDPTDFALDATLRASAPYQKRRKGSSPLAVNIAQSDIRLKVREKRVGNYLLFLVDASGSMGAKARMSATKGAVLSLLLDAYQKRDRVALVTFRGKEAKVALPSTSSIEMAARLLEELPVGGRTPLTAGLVETGKQLHMQLAKDPDCRPMVIVLTDGKANAGLGDKLAPHEEALKLASKMGLSENARYVVVDTEPQGIVCLGLANRLSQALHAEYFKIENLKAQDLVDIAKRID